MALIMTLADSSPHAEPANDLKVVKRDSLPNSSSSGELKWRGLNGGTSEASGSIQMKSRIRDFGISLAIWSAVSPWGSIKSPPLPWRICSTNRLTSKVDLPMPDMPSMFKCFVESIEKSAFVIESRPREMFMLWASGRATPHLLAQRTNHLRVPTSIKRGLHIEKAGRLR